MQVCTLLQTDNHANTLPLSFLQAGCPSCRPTNSVKALKALQLGKMNANSSPVPAGRRGGADLRFCSPQPDTTLHCLRDHGYGAIAHRVACLQCLLPSFRRYKQLPYLQTLWKSGEICRQTTEMQGAILNVFFFYVRSTCVMYLNC